MPGKSPASFLQTAAGIFERLNTNGDGQLARAWQTVNPWVTRFLASAATKWIPILANEAPCQIATPNGQGGWVPCSHPAVSFCDCCGLPTCLHHCRTDANAGVICFPCVAVARAVAHNKRASRDPPPQDGAPKEAKAPPKQKLPREEALAMLGLKVTATDQEIKFTYKALVKKWHPDKHGEADKAAAAARFKEIQKAWESLKP